MPQQINMFGSKPDDLPLFSGTAPRATLSAFNPGTGQVQLSFPVNCKFCKDTGLISVRGKEYICNCRLEIEEDSSDQT